MNEFEPRVVIVDPITNFLKAGTLDEAEGMLMRLIDFLKDRQITAIFTSLTLGGGGHEESQAGMSSLADTWLVLRDVESAGERDRALYVLKSRGMAHSNQIREFRLTDHGVELLGVSAGVQGRGGRKHRRGDDTPARAAGNGTSETTASGGRP